jgi:hypothetical protein
VGCEQRSSSESGAGAGKFWTSLEIVDFHKKELTQSTLSYIVGSRPMRTASQTQERQKSRNSATVISARIERSSMLAPGGYHREQGQFSLPRPVAAANLDWGTKPGP